MLYSIIIPVYSNKTETERCLLSLCDNIDETNTEIIVVSNGSNEETNKFLREFEESHKFATCYYYDKPLGFSKAINIGIKESHGDFVILLNNDTIIQNNQWISMLHSPFYKYQKCGVSGPVAIWSPEVEEFFVLFFCAMISRECLNEVGMLDEDFNVGCGEDIAFCTVARDHGFKIILVPEDDKKETILSDGRKKIYGNFPIIHEAGKTVNNPSLVDGFKDTYEDNLKKLADKFRARTIKKFDGERALIGPKDLDKCFREKNRYMFARDQIIKKFGLEKNKRILDLSCGSGYGTYILSMIPNTTVDGVDISKKAISFAKEYWQNHNIEYICDDFHNFLSKVDDGYSYDAIVCFETLEHLSMPILESTKLLRRKADFVIISTPYDETPGYWGKYHKICHVKEADFVGFDIYFLNAKNGVISKNKDENKWYLMIGVYDKFAMDRVTITIPTCDRYDILPFSIQSLLLQTGADWDLLIVDATPKEKRKRVSDLWFLRNTLNRVLHSGHNWQIVYNDQMGPNTSHNIALNRSKTLYNFRMDDDTILGSHDVLRNLIEVIKSDNEIAAVAPLVLDPSNNVNDLLVSIDQPAFIYNYNDNYQWRVPSHTQLLNLTNAFIKAEHLHCAFLYRTDYARGVGGWDTHLKIGFREETDFTYRLHKNGKKLLIDSRSIIWHYKCDVGGSRREDGKRFFESDNKYWIQKVKNDGDILVEFDMGMGDTLCMSAVFSEIKERMPGKRLFVKCAYPFLVKGMQNVDGIITTINDEIRSMFSVVFSLSVYKHGIYNSDKDSSIKFANLCLKNIGLNMISNTEIDNLLNIACVDKNIDHLYDINSEKTIVISPCGGRNYIKNNSIVARRKDIICSHLDDIILVAKKSGFKVAQIGSIDDNAANNVDIDLRGINIHRAFGCLAKCKTFICCDSVGAHAAACLGKKGVVIFRNTLSSVFGHYNALNIQTKCPHGYRCRVMSNTFGIEVSEDVCNQECLNDIGNYKDKIVDFILSSG